MNVKQIIGVVLLVFMIVVSYALFGGISHEKVPVQPITYSNVTPTNETTLQVYHEVTFEEKVAVDVGYVVLMIVLIGITSLGGITNPDESIWRDEEESLDGEQK